MLRNIYLHGRWRGLDDVEPSTRTYVDWFNHQRLHAAISDDANCTTPAAFEAAYHGANRRALRP